MRQSLADRTAIVTGASRGIGAAIAVRLAASGARVALLARDQSALESVAGAIAGQGGQAAAVRCDVTSRESVDEAIAAVTRTFGVPLLLVNNAGYGGPFHRTDEVSSEEWDAIFAVNVRSAFYFCGRLLPRMKEAGFGRVVNIASILGVAGGARSSTYSAAKHALVGYTKSIAGEWGRHGITCNAICPGYVRTAMLEGHGPAPESSLALRVPAGRLAQPEEIASAVEHLCGTGSAYVNGAALVIDGGLLAGLPE